MIDAVTGGEEVTRKEQPRLYNILENLCISRGITMPRLKVADDEALNAFASGLNEKQYSITVTHGLLDRLDDKEIEAVLGHELTHIRNGDVRMLVIAVIIAGVIGFFAELLFRLMFQGGLRFGGGRSLRRQRPRQGRRRHRHRHRHRPGRGGVAALGGDPLRAVAKARVSRRCRLGGTDQGPRRHDLGAAQDRRPRRARGRALRRHGNVHRQPARRALPNLFDTHPPVESRIAALVQFAGGHDPGPLDLPEPDESSPQAPDAGSRQPGPWSSATSRPASRSCRRAACHARRPTPPEPHRPAPGARRAELTRRNSHRL